jgi:hypothetical protein
MIGYKTKNEATVKKAIASFSISSQLIDYLKRLRNTG